MKSNSPKVSIITISYNQEDYIEAALDSFVSQKVNFPFEIIVADDASKDKTQTIIKRFEKEYPHLFNNILRKKNVGAQLNFKEAILSARGEYIALCEGDDFWTDTTKLQRQVDFLDGNKDYALCFHPVRVFYEDGREKDYIYPPKPVKAMSLETLLQENFIQTNSVMYRRQNYNELPIDILPLDWYLHLFHSQYGKIGYIDEVMAAYRRHENGIWWGSASGDIDEVWKKFGIPHLRLFIEVGRLYGSKAEYKSIVNGHIYRAYEAIVRTDLRYSQNKLQEAINVSSVAIANYVYESFKLHKEAVFDLKHHADEQAKIIAHQVDMISHQKEVIRNVEDQNQKLNSKLQMRIERVLKKQRSNRKSR